MSKTTRRICVFGLIACAGLAKTYFRNENPQKNYEYQKNIEKYPNEKNPFSKFVLQQEPKKESERIAKLRKAIGLVKNRMKENMSNNTGEIDAGSNETDANNENDTDQGIELTLDESVKPGYEYYAGPRMSFILVAHENADEPKEEKNNEMENKEDLPDSNENRKIEEE